MAKELDDEARAAGKVVLRRSSGRSLAVLVSLAALAMIAAAGVYLWFNFDRLAEASSAPEPPRAAVVDDSAALRDIQAQQQQTAGALDALKQSLAAEQADVNRISDQLSTLTSRVEALQNPPPPPAPVADVAPPEPRPAKVASRKLPPRALSRPVGPVSVGGAPLGPPPHEDH